MAGTRRWQRGALAAALAAVAAIAWAQDAGFEKMVQEARAMALQLLKGVGGPMLSELQRTGAARTVLVCKYSSPEVASELSRKSGWRVARISLRPRNPSLAAPDAWEQQVLQEFDQRAARGEKPDTIEHAEIVTEAQGRYFRYLKALPVREACLECHGPAERLDPATKERLAAEYPFDKATGYHVGEIRGAVTVKRPL